MADVTGPNFGADQGHIVNATGDIKKGWVYEVARGISPEEAQTLCVQHAEWQKVRLSMKGVPTAGKLWILLKWWHGQKDISGKGELSNWVDSVEKSSAVRQKQVINYLGALRRGGQLDDNNMIRKYI